MHVTLLPYFKCVDGRIGERLADMDFFFLSGFQGHFRMDRTRVLSFFWIVGLIVGIGLGCFSSAYLSDLIQACLTTHLRFYALLSSMIVPFFLAYMSFALGWYPLLYLLMFSEAFLISYHSTILQYVYPGAGWLLSLLLLFSDLICSAVLWMFCIRSVRCCGRQFAFRMIPAFAAVFLICSVDYSLVSPFLGVVLS